LMELYCVEDKSNRKIVEWSVAFCFLVQFAVAVIFLHTYWPVAS